MINTEYDQLGLII